MFVMVSDKRLLTPVFRNLVRAAYSQELQMVLSAGMVQISAIVSTGEQTVVSGPAS